MLVGLDGLMDHRSMQDRVDDYVAWASGLGIDSTSLLEGLKESKYATSVGKQLIL